MSNLQVNFTTHGHDLRAAYDAILRPTDPKNGDNWAIFGYDKGTNDLKVLNRGNGGLEELEEEFMDGKIQYAFARIIDPNSQLNKFVLIAWVWSSSLLFVAFASFLAVGPRCQAIVRTNWPEIRKPGRWKRAVAKLVAKNARNVTYVAWHLSLSPLDAFTNPVLPITDNVLVYPVR